MAKVLRLQATDAERRLWALLRRRQLQFRFRRQQPIGPYIVDFFCSAARLIVELDGGQHATDHARAYDERSTQWLKERGYHVLRFDNAVFLKEPQLVVEGIARTVMTCLGSLPEAPAALRPSLEGRV